MLASCWSIGLLAVDYAAGKKFEILSYLSGNGRRGASMAKARR
jgi:hypothetical protein